MEQKKEAKTLIIDVEVSNMDDGGRSVGSAWEEVTIVIGEEDDDEEMRRVAHLVLIPIANIWKYVVHLRAAHTADGN